MDTKTLVFIRRKGAADFDDEPANVSSCRKTESGCDIRFAGSGRTYSFARENVAVCTCNERHDAASHTFAVTLDGRDSALSNVNYATRYSSDNPAFEDRICVTFSDGCTRLYPASQIVVADLPDQSLQQETVRYLRDVAEAVAKSNETGDPTIDEYLLRQFGRLDNASVNATAARCMVRPGPGANETHKGAGSVIYPFGMNLSQIEATHNALSNTLSIIEGPPGTGKTQTILTIIANLVLRDKTVLVVSPNNEATKNVCDKLTANGYGFIVAALGNRENRSNFVANQQNYPSQIEQWGLSEAQATLLDSLTQRKVAEIGDAYIRQRELSAARAELREWELEQRLFAEEFPEVRELSAEQVGIGQLEQLRERIANEARERGSIRLLTKIKGRFGMHIGTWSDYSCTPVEFELRINVTLLRRHIEALRSRVRELEEGLAGFDLTASQDAVRKASDKLLRHALFVRYRNATAETGQSSRVRFSEQDLWRQPQQIRQEYPVITSTTNAARGQLGKGGEPFDWVIIDESSQVDIVTGFLALTCAKHSVVVGDTKQLPCVVPNAAAGMTDRIFLTAGMPARYRYSKESLLSCLELCVRYESLDAPITLLREHYRCHPDIIGFCNNQFYDNELVVMTDEEQGQSSPAVQVILTRNGHYDRTADYNHVQAELVSERVVPMLREEFADDNIGIVTPYRRQVHGMQQPQWGLSSVQIDTVHKYQGREKQAMVFVTCANETNDFLDNPNLVNVAVSRAKRQLILVTSPSILKSGGNVADLARYALRHSGRIEYSNTASAFDLIYPSRTKDREKYVAAHATAGDEYSEVRVEAALLGALRVAGVESRFGCVRNYPLRQFVLNLDALTERERAFVNTSAHADFLVFRKIDRQIVFELEVNGAQHAKDVQRERDEVKHAILDKLGIPYDTIQTHEAAREFDRHIAEIIGRICASDPGSRTATNVLDGLERE